MSVEKLTLWAGVWRKLVSRLGLEPRALALKAQINRFWYVLALAMVSPFFSEILAF